MNQDNIPADIFAEGIRAMPKNEALEIFDTCIQNAKEDGADPERIAMLEVVREFMCDRQFAKLMEDFVWEMNN